MFQIPGLSIFEPSGAREALNANRLAVDSSYNLMKTVQGHVEKATEIWWQQSMRGSQHLQKVQLEWLSLMQKEGEHLKQTVDVNFQTAADFLASRQRGDSEKKSSGQKTAAKQAGEAQGKKTTAKTQESSGKKASAKTQESTGEKASPQSGEASGESRGPSAQGKSQEPAKKEATATSSTATSSKK